MIEKMKAEEMNWLFFAGMAMLGLVLYPLGSRLAEGKISVIFGAMMVSVVAMCILATHFFVSRYMGNPEEISWTKEGLAYIAIAGIGAAMIDYGYLASFAKGGASNIVVPLVTVGSLAIIVLIGVMLFKEPLTASKIGGVFLGLVSIYLLTR